MLAALRAIERKLGDILETIQAQQGPAGFLGGPEGTGGPSPVEAANQATGLSAEGNDGLKQMADTMEAFAKLGLMAAGGG